MNKRTIIIRMAQRELFYGLKAKRLAEKLAIQELSDKHQAWRFNEHQAVRALREKMYEAISIRIMYQNELSESYKKKLRKDPVLRSLHVFVM